MPANRQRQLRLPLGYQPRPEDLRFLKHCKPVGQ